MPELTFFDQLAEAVKTCPGRLLRDTHGQNPQVEHGAWCCNGTRTVPNIDDPVFRALWERRGRIPYHGWHRRSRAEVALRLPGAVHQIGYAYKIYRSPRDEFAWADIRVPTPSHKDLVYEGHGTDDTDALSAAILVSLKAQEVKP